MFSSPSDISLALEDRCLCFTVQSLMPVDVAGTERREQCVVPTACVSYLLLYNKPLQNIIV